MTIAETIKISIKTANWHSAFFEVSIGVEYMQR